MNVTALDPPGRLAGQRILVTGAGRGLGAAIALACAREGGDIVLAGRTLGGLDAVAGQIRERGRRALTVEMDVTRTRSIDEVFARVEGAWGGLDGLVANSGVPGPTAPVWEVDDAPLEEVFSVNTLGVFRCCRAALAPMVERGAGRIVVIGSMTGKRPLAQRAAYAASKHALVGFVRSAALEAGPHGVRINLVSPGPVGGERLERVLQAQAAARGVSVEAERDEMFAAAPLGRAVQGDEVAAAVTFLLSSEAAGVTGEDLNVSAGLVGY